MPVHSREKKENNHEDMEVDFPEQDGSSTDEEDTVSSSVSEDGDSSGRKKKKKSGLKHQHTAKILKYTSESDVSPTQYVTVNENELTSWPSWVDTGWGGDAMMLMAVGESKELMSDLSLFTWAEMDDEDCERRRMECLDEMTTLEKQFTDLKEQ